MVRLAVGMVWMIACFMPIAGWATHVEAQAQNRAGVGLGAVLWAEIGGTVCRAELDVTSCSDGPDRVFLGGIAAFDLDLLHWLRLGLSGGAGYAGGEGTMSSTGERTTSRHWFAPLLLHMYWRVELGRHITLWGGPEAGVGLRVDARRFHSPRAPTITRRTTRAATMVGVAVGLDVRLGGALRLGIEIGEAVLVEPAGERRSAGDALDLRAMTRFALALRYL